MLARNTDLAEFALSDSFLAFSSSTVRSATSFSKRSSVIFLSVTSLSAVLLATGNSFDDIAQNYVNWNQANDTLIIKLIFVKV